MMYLYSMMILFFLVVQVVCSVIILAGASHHPFFEQRPKALIFILIGCALALLSASGGFHATFMHEKPSYWPLLIGRGGGAFYLVGLTMLLWRTGLKEITLSDKHYTKR